MNQKLKLLINVSYWVAVFAIVVFLAVFVFPKLLPFFLGFGVAALVNPLVSRWGKGKRRLLFSLLIIVPFWFIVLFLAWKIGSLIYSEAGEMLNGLRRINISSWIQNFPLFQNNPEWKARISQWIEAEIPSLLTLSQNLLLKLLNLLMKLPDAFLFCFSMIVSSLLISVSYPALEPFLLRQLPAKIQTEYFDIKEFLLKTILRVLRAYGVLFLINYTGLALGLTLLKASYPLILAAVIALLDLLPFIGTATVLIPWGLAEWFLFSDPFKGIGLLILAVVISIIREILQPKIVGKHIGLSPLATLIGIYVGLKTIGFAGVFLFPLIFLFLKEWNSSGRISLWKNSPE